MPDGFNFLFAGFYPDSIFHRLQLSVRAGEKTGQQKVPDKTAGVVRHRLWQVMERLSAYRSTYAARQRVGEFLRYAI